MQFSLLQSGHLKLLMLSLMKHHPSQSGVLQWNEFLEVAWTSFNDFCWCFSKTAGDTSYKKDKLLSPNKILHDKMSVVTFFIHPLFEYPCGNSRRNCVEVNFTFLLGISDGLRNCLQLIRMGLIFSYLPNRNKNSGKNE